MDGRGRTSDRRGMIMISPGGLTYFLPRLEGGKEGGREYGTSFRIAVIPYHHHEKEGRSVCPSVRPSVTLRQIERFAPHILPFLAAAAAAALSSGKCPKNNSAPPKNRFVVLASHQVAAARRDKWAVPIGSALLPRMGERRRSRRRRERRGERSAIVFS